MSPSKAATARWEHFPHGADIGVRGFGTTLEQAFQGAALALTAVITEPEGVASREAVRIELLSSDLEQLLVDWLNALVLEMATRGMLFGRFEVRVSEARLEARAWGERIDLERHQPAVEVKGATFTALRVAQNPDGTWVAQCVVDV